MGLFVFDWRRAFEPWFFRDMTFEKVWNGDTSPLAQAGMPAPTLRRLEEICKMKMETPYHVFHFIEGLYGTVPARRAALVTYNLVTSCGYDVNLAATLAILDGVGRQSVDSSERNNSKLAALLAARWLRSLDISRNLSVLKGFEEIVKIIYAQDDDAEQDAGSSGLATALECTKCCSFILPSLEELRQVDIGRGFIAKAKWGICVPFC